MAENESERFSRQIEPYIIQDEDDRAFAEAKNALVQFDQTVSIASRWIREKDSNLRPSLILELNRLALADIHSSAGTYRTGTMKIVGSDHSPVPASEVAAEIEKLCDYININWDSKSPIHLAAYALWRLNWIHPFADGNGRTARALSYLILCVKMGFTLPGLNTVPDQISSNKKPYYSALEAADRKLKAGSLDISEVEDLLKDRLANQLLSIYERADPAAGRLYHPDSKENTVAGQKTGFIQIIEAHPVLFTVGATLIVGILTILFT